MRTLLLWLFLLDAEDRWQCRAEYSDYRFNEPCPDASCYVIHEGEGCYCTCGDPNTCWNKFDPSSTD